MFLNMKILNLLPYFKTAIFDVLLNIFNNFFQVLIFYYSNLQSLLRSFLNCKLNKKIDDISHYLYPVQTSEQPCFKSLDISRLFMFFASKIKSQKMGKRTGIEHLSIVWFEVVLCFKTIFNMKILNHL